MADSEDWIKKRAYELWEAEGYPTGKDSEHWEQAKLEHATMKPVAGASSSSRRKGNDVEAFVAVKAAAKSAPKSTSTTPAKSAPKPDVKAAAAPVKGKVAASKADTSTTSERAAPPVEEPVKKRAKKVSAGK